MRQLPLLFLTSVLATIATAQTPPAWSQALTGPQPSLRSLHGLVHDSARQRTVMFGGWDYPNSSWNAETWEWNGSVWSQVATANAPSPRSQAQLAFDSVRNRIVLFGGWIPGTAFNDTWEYDGTNWIQRQPIVAPSGRASAALAYDPVRQVTVLFAGYEVTGATGVYDNETWEWNGSTWTQRFPAQSPSARSTMTMCYNPLTQRMLAFGGVDLGGSLRDLWAYNGTNWTLLDVAGPVVENTAGMVWHPVRQRVTLLGSIAQELGQWTWDGSLWRRECGVGAPSPRRAFQVAYHAPNQRIVVFGGDDLAVTNNETWLLDAGNPTVLSVTSVGAGCSSGTGTVVLQAQTLPMIGTQFTTRMTGAPAGIALFLYGVTPLPGLPVGGLPAGCLAYVQPEVIVATSHGGIASTSLGLPCDPALYGFALRVQAAALIPQLATPLPLATSNALAVVVGS